MGAGCTLIIFTFARRTKCPTCGSHYRRCSV